MDAIKKFLKKFIKDTKETSKKLPSWLLPVLLIAAFYFIVVALSSGFGFWFFIVLIFWFLVFYKGLPWLVTKSINVLYIFIIVIVTVSFIMVNNAQDSSTSNSSSNTSKTSDSSKSAKSDYAISGAEQIVAGWAGVDDVGDGEILVDFVIVVEDSDIVSNGKCIDKTGSWCANDPDGLHARIEAIRYHYAMTFKNTEKSEVVASSTLWPVHCNGDILKANPRDFSVNVVPYSDQADLTCGKSLLVGFEPTSLFVVRNRATFDSLDTFLNSKELAVYDTSDTFTISESRENNSQSVSSGNSLSSNEYHTAKKFKTYSISIN